MQELQSILADYPPDFLISEQDAKKLADRVLNLAQQGDRDANALVGYWYEVGLVVEMNIQESKQHYKHAAFQGSGLAAYNLGRIYFSEKEFEQAFEWLKIGNNCREGQACALFGYLLENGIGCQKDIPNAIAAYRIGVEAGCLDATLHLVSCWHRGLTDVIDIDYCAKLLQSELDSTNVKGWFELGMLELRLAEQKGCVKIPDSIRSIEKAAELGDKDATLWCAETYCMGLGTQPDYQKGPVFLEAAIQFNSSRAKYLKAVLLATGKGLEMSSKRAFQLCEEAAKEGEPDAVRMLELMILRGKREELA